VGSSSAARSDEACTCVVVDGPHDCIANSVRATSAAPARVSRIIMAFVTLPPLLKFTLEDLLAMGAHHPILDTWPLSRQHFYRSEPSCGTLGEMLAVSILGCSGSYAAAGGACTGYLMQSPRANVWLDAGPGTLANLQTICRLADIDAIVLTHAHPDHWLELPVVANAIQWYEPRDPVPVYSNAHMAQRARDLIGPDIDGPFTWHIVDSTDQITIGDQRWSFADTDHYVPTLATRTDVGRETIVFSSDTGPSFSLASLAQPDRPIDLAIIESTFLERSEHPGALHLSADEAGQMASQGNVLRVLLTHQAPLEDRAAHLAKASANFSGQIVLAEVGQQYPATVT